jgi:hypothetical protein
MMEYAKIDAEWSMILASQCWEPLFAGTTAFNAL